MKTKGAAEILVKRRLGIFKNLIDELQLRVEVRLVKVIREQSGCINTSMEEMVGK